MIRLMTALPVVLALSGTAQAQINFGQNGIADRLAAPIMMGVPGGGAIAPLLGPLGGGGSGIGAIASGLGIGGFGGGRTCIVNYGVIAGDVRGGISNNVRVGNTSNRC